MRIWADALRLLWSAGELQFVGELVLTASFCSRRTSVCVRILVCLTFGDRWTQDSRGVYLQTVHQFVANSTHIQANTGKQIRADSDKLSSESDELSPEFSGKFFDECEQTRCENGWIRPCLPAFTAKVPKVLHHVSTEIKERSIPREVAPKSLVPVFNDVVFKALTIIRMC